MPTGNLGYEQPLCPAQEARLFVISEVVPIVFGGLVPGFLLGLLAFRVKSRWCPRCGGYTHAVPPPPEGQR
ncbi:hypothetical protein GSF22_29060 [Micromonospora echinofusca]|uniref:Brain protein I3 n=1 Tax=Micromonospora echinofusca TaxID=47858 RepID=A0ABS3VZY8_MICEH|nr:hypothetical protein [Micromonospora echinofusca]